MGAAVCRNCGEGFTTKGKGRPPAYCSDRCRQAGHRERHENIPLYQSGDREYDPEAEPPPKSPDRPWKGRGSRPIRGRALRVFPALWDIWADR
jgi:hypothetical protein